jgi:glycosyltransferase involved in cell wall biosynthesis
MFFGKLHSFFTKKRQIQISVIIPVYNTEVFLHAALISVLDQTLDTIEIICIDDCSSDGSLDILNAFQRLDSRIKIHRLQKRMGAGHARNTGINAALGQYVRFMDSDDLMPRHSLETLLDLAQTSQVKLVRGAVSAFETIGKIHDFAMDSPPRRMRYTFCDEPRLWKPWWFQTYLFHQSLLKGGSLRFPDLKDGEDPVFLAAALCKADLISSTDDIVYHYRIHPGQRRNNTDYMRHLAFVRDIFVAREPRAWFDGYGKFSQDIEIPNRMMKPETTPEELQMMPARMKELMAPTKGYAKPDETP